MEQEIRARNIEIHLIERKRFDAHGKFVLFFVIGLGLIYGGYYIGAHALDSGVISTVPLVIIILGIGAIGFAFSPLNFYYRALNAAKRKKQRMDDVLNIYHIRYNIGIEANEGFHDIEVATRLDITKP